MGGEGGWATTNNSAACALDGRGWFAVAAKGGRAKHGRPASALRRFDSAVDLALGKPLASSNAVPTTSCVVAGLLHNAPTVSTLTRTRGWSGGRGRPVPERALSAVTRRRLAERWVCDQREAARPEQVGGPSNRFQTPPHSLKPASL